MISIADLVRLPYTTDLTEGGIAYACRSLPHTFHQGSNPPFDRLRRTVAGVAVELAFRRHLTRQAVPFDVRSAAPFSEPDRYDVMLGGHRCDIETFLISHRAQVASLQRDPDLLLQAPALVPLDQYSAEGRSGNELYLFAFPIGLVAASPEEVRKAFAAGQPVFLIHTLPRAWMHPSSWIPLGPLALKSESEEPIRVELGGQSKEREFISCTIELLPHTRLEVSEDFYSLAYLRAESKPRARLGVHTPSRRETHVIEPVEWGNIWIDGREIWLAGWISHDEFRRRARLVPAGSPILQRHRTFGKNLGVPLADLKPLSDLLERVRSWQAGR